MAYGSRDSHEMYEARTVLVHWVHKIDDDMSADKNRNGSECADQMAAFGKMPVMSNEGATSDMVEAVDDELDDDGELLTAEDVAVAFTTDEEEAARDELGD